MEVLHRQVAAGWDALRRAHEAGVVSIVEASALMWLLHDVKLRTIVAALPIELAPGAVLGPEGEAAEAVAFCEAVRLDARSGLSALRAHRGGYVLSAACHRALLLRRALTTTN